MRVLDRGCRFGETSLKIAELVYSRPDGVWMQTSSWAVSAPAP